MNPENIINTTKFNVTSADIDMFSRIKMGSLVNFLIQSAINSADELGFGFAGLKKHRLFWVLSRLTVEIYKPISWNKTIVVETWPKDIERIFYLRDFVVKTQVGETIANATSAWLAIDVENKRPKTIDSKQTEAFSKLKNKHALNYQPEKLVTKAEKQKLIKNTNYFDIDLNKHVTSTRYIDWIMDTFSKEFHEKNYPKKLSVNYLKETMLGQSIAINKQNNENNEFLIDGVNLQNQKTVFKAKINF